MNSFHSHFILLLLASALLFIFMVQGRQFPNMKLDGEMKWKVRSVIGSRPPKCEQRCRNCGECEAVQVPIAHNTIQYSRGDDVSSYKPMCWKCKCGNFLFNP